MNWSSVFNNNGNNGNNSGTDWTTLFAVTTTEMGSKVEAEGGKTRDHVTTTTAAALKESVANQNKNKNEILDALNPTEKKEAWYIAIMILVIAVVVGLVCYRYGIKVPEFVKDAAGNDAGKRPDWWTIASRGACWSMLISSFMMWIPLGNKKGGK